VLNDLLGNTEFTELEQLQAKFLTARQAMAEYAHKQDNTLLPAYLNNHPVLLQLLGDKFFHGFELLRYVHGGPPGRSSTMETHPMQVISAALGMGILVHMLETLVMHPLMKDHPPAHHILHAAEAVEHFAPLVVDGVPQSLWWKDQMPFASTFNAPEKDIELRAASEEITYTLPPEAEQLEELPFLTPGAVAQEQAFFDAQPSQPPVSPGHDPVSSQAASPQIPSQTSFPPTSLQAYHPGQLVNIPELPPLSNIPALNADCRRWDELMKGLPAFISCPNRFSERLLHHQQGSALLSHAAKPNDWAINTWVKLASEQYPHLLKSIHTNRCILGEFIYTQTAHALTHHNARDYIMNVLAPSLLRAKVGRHVECFTVAVLTSFSQQHYVIQVAKAFMLHCDLELEEAQSEALYITLTDKFWEKDILTIDGNHELWVDYSCILPSAAIEQISEYCHDSLGNLN
jgi:hypothetical protein